MILDERRLDCPSNESEKLKHFRTNSNTFKQIRIFLNGSEPFRTVSNVGYGFLPSQLSPVRRKNATTGALAMGKPLDPAIRLSAHS